MTEDFFALLGEPRRPWLDTETIKEKFHQLSRTEHPDQQAEQNADDFARINRAQATLREANLRLRHLLELEYPEVKLSGPTTVPTDLTDLFEPVYVLLGENAAVLKKKSGASSALAKALLVREEFAAREKVEILLEKLDALHATTTEELRAFDARWSEARSADDAATLHGFYQRFAYLARWTEQLRESLFELGV